MRNLIGCLRETYIDVWYRADPRTPPLGSAHPLHVQANNEIRLRAFVDLLESESKRRPRTPDARRDAEARVLAAFAEFACPTLGWRRQDLDTLMASGFPRAMRAFPGLARQFDPQITAADIYQAARNALTAHCLQSLLGVEVRATPAILGYSLLYPYTDNYLDDAGLDRASKLAFSGRLAARLAGTQGGHDTPREGQIFGLVGMIESQFSRSRHPRVFESLLAIHRAQEHSLDLLDAAGMPDVLEISVEKGGASVLADGYLAAGLLTDAQAECLFGLGVFLQLRDDLEDVTDDEARGLRTVFSSPAGPRLLDEPTARALAIGSTVLERLDCFESPAADAVRGLMKLSLLLTITDAAASVPSRYSAGFLKDLEAHSPIRLACLAKQRQRLSRAKGSLTGLLETWLNEAGPSPFEDSGDTGPATT